MKKKECFTEPHRIFQVLESKILFVLIALFICTNVNAQDIIVSGTVSDSKGEPLSGANIVEKSTINGVTADFDGNYSIKLNNPKAVLIFSYIGYNTQEIIINGENVINVVLSEDSSHLDEVIVVGYGTQKKTDFTGSVSSVNSDDFESIPLNNFSGMLQGAVAGVQVVKGNYQPGAGSTIRVRGGNSMIGSNDPLYVVDGFPASTIPNPNDIESIQVLKDASATAIYGSRGANGVIIISTKRGTGEPRVSFDSYYGIQTVRKKLELLSPEEYVTFANEKAANIGIDPYFPDVNNIPGNTDWQDEIFTSAPMANYNLSIVGGNDNNKYAISGNHYIQKGIIKNSDHSMSNLRVNLDNKISDSFKVSTSINVSHGETSQSRSPVINGLVSPPVAPVYNEDGSFFSLSVLPTADPTWNNPVLILNQTFDKGVTNELNSNINLELKLLDGLTYSLRGGMVYENRRSDFYFKKLASSSNEARISENDSYSYLLENILSYKKLYNQVHALDLTAGYTWQEDTFSGFSAGASNFVDDKLLTDDLSSGGVVSTPTSSKERSNIISWLGRVNYFFDNKYLVTLTTRADGSSRLGANNKWGVFPSAAVAWRMSEENWMKNSSSINNLKLRLSYGVTGNQGIGNYKSLSRLNSVIALQGDNEARIIGYVPIDLENPDLKWEVTKQFDAGLDIGLFNGNLDLTLDYYVKRTSDLLASVPLSLSAGYSSILKNFGDMENKGFELSIDSKIIQNSDLVFNVGANLSVNKNKILKVATETGQFFGPVTGSPIDNFINIIKEGYPLSSMYGYRTDGLWESDQTIGSIQPTALAGDQRYVDENGDGAITSDDRVVLGAPYPDFTYGFNSMLSYKNFGLNLLIQGVQGGQIFNANKFTIGDSFARNGNQLIEVRDHWSSQNPDPNALYPRLSNVSPLISDRFFEDASYLRLKNISLSYSVPTDKVNWMEDLMLYISAENFLTITNYSGYDPEISGNSGLLRGMDRGAYPSTKTLTLGIKTTF